jgi:hypothetical protein
MVPTGKMDSRIKQKLSKPICIAEYNNNRGVVDKSHMQISFYESVGKSTKWYKKNSSSIYWI